MNKELRKRIWEEREKVQDLIDDVEVGEYIEERTFYQMCRKAPCFSTGDIRHVRRICVSN
nr:MAG TPA: hypothetical protein [Caudoviricetes sp.]